MADYLAAQEAISFGYDATLDVVTPEDQKLGLAASGVVTLNRPDKIRATRSAGFADIEMLFDGKILTLLGKNANLYTQVELSGTLDKLIDELREKYKRPLPAADLLLSNPYDELMLDVIDTKDLGSGVIDGVDFSMRFSHRLMETAPDNFSVFDDNRADHRIGRCITQTAPGQLKGRQHKRMIVH